MPWKQRLKFKKRLQILQCQWMRHTRKIQVKHEHLDIPSGLSMVNQLENHQKITRNPSFLIWSLCQKMSVHPSRHAPLLVRSRFPVGWLLADFRWVNSGSPAATSLTDHCVSFTNFRIWIVLTFQVISLHSIKWLALYL